MNIPLFIIRAREEIKIIKEIIKIITSYYHAVKLILAEIITKLNFIKYLSSHLVLIVWFVVEQYNFRYACRIRQLVRSFSSIITIHDCMTDDEILWNLFSILLTNIVDNNKRCFIILLTDTVLINAVMSFKVCAQFANCIGTIYKRTINLSNRIVSEDYVKILMKMVTAIHENEFNAKWEWVPIFSEELRIFFEQ